MNPKTLYLIRHGETHSNLGDIVQGWNESLTPIGLAQARSLAKRLFLHCGIYPIEAIYTSRMERAKLTATIIERTYSMPIARKMAGVELRRTFEKADPLPLIESAHLHERLHPSYLHGLSTKDPIAQRALAEMRANFHNPTFDYADGETFTQLIDRVDLAIDELMRDPHEHIAVVSHGVFLPAFICRLLHGAHLTSHMLARQGFKFPNAGIVKVTHSHDLRNDGHAWGWTIQVGDNSHTFGIE